MATKKVEINNATIKILTGFIPHIGKYVPGALKAGMLPIKVIIKDPSSGEEYDAELTHLVPFQHSIPEVFSLLAENLYANEAVDVLFEKHNVERIENLAFYLYTHVKSNN